MSLGLPQMFVFLPKQRSWKIVTWVYVCSFDILDASLALYWDYAWQPCFDVIWMHLSSKGSFSALMLYLYATLMSFQHYVDAILKHFNASLTSFCRIHFVDVFWVAAYFLCCWPKQCSCGFVRGVFSHLIFLMQSWLYFKLYWRVCCSSFFHAIWCTWWV